MRRALSLTSLALLAWAQALYGPALKLLVRPRPHREEDVLPTVTLVIAAYAEEDVIEAKVADALGQDYPRDRLQVVVACDGSPDRTPELARRAGADVVLELPRGGKVAAQDAAVRQARSEVIAFSDANARWAPDALRTLVRAFADPEVAYACGRVSFEAEDGATNQEGVYWRYDLWLRALESERASVTAGNGAIYAVRRADYVEVDPVMGHDLMLPHTLVRRGRRCVYVPAARAVEKMVPTVEGEGARKRRMMSHAWAIVLRGGLLSPAGLPPVYLLMLASHRWLRYGGPLLHLVALLTSRGLLLAGQLAVLVLAAAGARAGRPGLLSRYYVATQGAILLGLADHLRHGTEAGWSPPEGTR